MNIKASSARKLRRLRVYCEGVFTAETQRGEAAAKKGKANFTTKEDAKSTKFIIKKIRTLRGLRDLRGEDIFSHRKTYPPVRRI
jgi:hypothetical protein